MQIKKRDREQDHIVPDASWEEILNKWVEKVPEAGCQTLTKTHSQGLQQREQHVEGPH